MLNKFEIEPKIIIPVSMNHKIGIDIVLNSIMKFMGPELCNKKNVENPLFMISRSFDINHVNISYKDIVGGVIGGSLIGGNLKIGDEIELLPGIISKNPDGTLSHKPHITTITSLKSETTELQEITSGGLIGIGTNIDPFYCKNDSMIGMIAGLKGSLPPVYYEITIKYNEIKFDDFEWTPFIGKPMIIIVGTNNIEGKILNFNDEYIQLKLNKPACIPDDSIIILCNKSYDTFHIIAYGNFNNIDNNYEFTKELPKNEEVSETVNTTLSDDSIDIDDI
jgi:translation initiation factor 2 subunit 3